jgi:hypothetical protein
MKTKQEIIDLLKIENPVLRVGNDNDGYTELSADEYEAIIVERADAILAKEQATAEAKTLREFKISAYEKLGLSASEIAALLPVEETLVRPNASA